MEADDWRLCFGEAVLENDRERRIEKIARAEKILRQRLQDVKDDSEQKILNDAMIALKIMRG